MGSGADKKKSGSKKSNIRTYDQKPEIVKEEVELKIEQPVGADLADVIRAAEELQKHPLLCGDCVFSDDAPLAIAIKTLQRFIDRLKAI